VPWLDLGIALRRSVGGIKYNIDIGYTGCSINFTLSTVTSEI
jgi:hypothetical protein